MLSSSYEHKQYEDALYKKWEEAGAFTPDTNPNKKPFTISMPPPNATGTLHLGHAVMLALEDIMIRHKRMQGYNALWLPGTDHAAIATQTKVEKVLAAEEGITREQLGRELFLERVKAYVADSQDTIRKQVRKMGSSCDWTRERYTFDDNLNKAVTEVFVRMYEDDLIYRGYRIVNWCPRCESTLADDEVEHAEIEGNFYHIAYPLKESNDVLIVATTRPETMLGDTAVAVNPKDKRFAKYIGQTVILPLMNRKITVIGDEYVDMETGTGALKVTPAHDQNDFEIGKRHNLETINVMHKDGSINHLGGKYAGLDRKEARKQVLKDLEELGLLVKVKPHLHSVGHCYRCDTVIEPLTSDQWFINVNKKFVIQNAEKLGLKDKNVSLKEVANHVIKNKNIEIIPERFNKTYFHWMENLRDWCISRQIWWGHRIPVWYCDTCGEVIVSKKTPENCPECNSTKLRQDEDTLDTWFSSGLWTFSTLGWPEKTADLEYFHPTSVMETGYDILFFWVARMILMSTYALGEIPFEKVYLHGLLRDREGRKMSKSLGNGIDPLEMIEKYGTDALRMALFIGSTAGNDSKIYEEKIEGFRNFVNKIWNVARYVDTRVPLGKTPPNLPLSREEQKNSPLNKGDLGVFAAKEPLNQWITSEIQHLIKNVSKSLDEFKFSEAGQMLYDFMWGEFADWYLEMSKKSDSDETKQTLLYVLETLLKLLHPFMPFVTEQIWSEMHPEEMLITASWPVADKNLVNKEAEKKMTLIKNIVQEIRSKRAESKVNPVKKITAIIISPDKFELVNELSETIKFLANLEKLEVFKNAEKPEKAVAMFVGKTEIYLPLADMLDLDEERKRIEKEIGETEKFLAMLKGKLSNKKFVQNAPESVVNGEKEKAKGAEAKLEKLRGQLQEF